MEMPEPRKRPFLHEILPIGLLVGSLDILAAIGLSIAFGNGPVPMLRAIASGAFGPEAFQEQMFYPLMGLAFHYTIALFWTWLFHWAHSILHFPSSPWPLTGIIYGLFVWAVMNLAVLPLSRLPATPMEPGRSIMGILVLIFAVGLPLAYFFRERP